MKYSRVLILKVLSVAVVVFADCCPLDSAISEIEMLQWLDNPEASLRDLKQDTEEFEWLDSPFAHVSDVRHANFRVEKNQELVLSQIKNIEQVSEEQVKPTGDHHAVSPILMPKEEQKPQQVPQEEQKLANKFLAKPVDLQLPEKIPVDGERLEEVQNTKEAPLVSQDQQKAEQDVVDSMNPGQLHIEEKKFDQITHQHRHASPTPPASIQEEKKPDQVILEQVPETEQKAEPVLVEKQKDIEIPAKEKKPEQVEVEVKEPKKVPVVSGQVPIDEPRPEQIPVENKKLEQVFFEQKKNPVKPVDQQLPEKIPVDGERLEEVQNTKEAPLVSQDQQKAEQDVVDSMNPEQLHIEEEKFDQITHQHRHASPTPPASIQEEKKPDQVILEQVPGTEQKAEPVLVEKQKDIEIPAKEKKPEQVEVEVKEPEKVPVVSGQVPIDEPVENKKLEQVFFEQKKNPVIPVEQHKTEQAAGTETSEKTQVDPVKKQMPSTISTVSVHSHKPNHISPIRFEDSGCFWSGTAPFCRGKCGRFYREKVVNKTGDGKTCLTGVKMLCCPISLTSLIG